MNLFTKIRLSGELRKTHLDAFYFLFKKTEEDNSYSFLNAIFVNRRIY